MAADQLQLEVVTPTRAVLNESVDEVVLPGLQGQLGILPGHLPLLTGLSIGQMVVRTASGERRFFIDEGFAEVVDDKISVLTKDCEGVNEIDIEHARAEASRVESEISRLERQADVVDDEATMLELYRQSLKRARTRLLVADDTDRDS